MNKNGYTLMELVVVIGVMLVIIGSGMAVFYQSLRSGSKIDFELFLDSSSRLIENSMVGVIEYSRIVSLEGQDQDACLAAGPSGVLGNSLIVDIEGNFTEYALEDGYITSSSAETRSYVNINPDGVSINILSFNWVCLYGETERLIASFTAQAEKDDQEVAILKEFSFEMLLKNSGYY